MENKELRFETPEKPELENIETIHPDVDGFNNEAKAEALIRNLSLEVGSIIRQDDDYSGEQYTINPRMVLSGDAPGKYELEIKEAKIIA